MPGAVVANQVPDLVVKSMKAIQATTDALKTVTKDVIEFKHQVQAETSRDNTRFAILEEKVRMTLERIKAILGDYYNIIIANDYAQDKLHLESPADEIGSFPNLVVQFGGAGMPGEETRYRIRLFTSTNGCKYDRPMGPSWEHDGIQCWGAGGASLVEERPPGCMYISFPAAPGLTEEQYQQINGELPDADGESAGQIEGDQSGGEQQGQQEPETQGEGQQQEPEGAAEGEPQQQDYEGAAEGEPQQQDPEGAAEGEPQQQDDGQEAAGGGQEGGEGEGTEPQGQNDEDPTD